MRSMIWRRGKLLGVRFAPASAFSMFGIEVRRACILGYGGQSSGLPLGLSPAPIMLTVGIEIERAPL